MKNLHCIHTHAAHVQDAVQEFNERAAELGIVSEGDVVSVSVLPVTSPIKIHDPKEGTKNSSYEVVFVYWSTHPTM